VIGRTHRGRCLVPAALRGAAVASASAVALVVAVLPSVASTTSVEVPGGAVQAAATGGCGRTPTLRNGTHSLRSSNKDRTYILKIPDGYTNTKQYRLIFAFHWWGGSANEIANGGTTRPYYGLQALANNSAIFVAPQGLNNGGGDGWANMNGEDMTFVDDMIKTIEADLCVDTTQLYSLGFSYGGGMSYAIACARPDVFRAVAIYSGGLISGCSGGNKPIAYMQVHGVSDNVLPINTARTMRDRFVRNNGCTAQNPTDPSQGSNRHSKVVYQGCSAPYPVVWYAFDGGHTPVPPDSGGNWLPAETWNFFSQFATS